MRKTEEELRNEFAIKARNILADAQSHFDQGQRDDALMKALQHVMIYADEDTAEWKQAKALFEETKKKLIEETIGKAKAEEELKRQEKEKKAQNLKKLHIGLIDSEGFYNNRGDLRDFTFITLIDGYNKLMYWNMDEDDYADDDDDEEYENENWDDSDDKEYKIVKEVFFHISDKGEGSIKQALDSIRSDSSDEDMDEEDPYDEDTDEEKDTNRGIGVVFEIIPAKKGKKAINVRTIEDAVADENVRKYLEEMIKVDVNVYFFLMEQVPNLYAKFFSKTIYEKIWEYKENNDSIELVGAHLKKIGCWNWRKQRRSEDYYFPSTKVFLPDCISGKPVTVISASAFAQTENVEKFIIPETISYIGERAFEDCHYLRDINLPQGIKKIASRTFASCSFLKTITFPDQLTEIGEEAFTESGLQYLTIPSSVSTIGNNAFSRSQLISVELPQNIQNLGEEVFDGCKGLKRVVFQAQSTFKKIEKGMFKDCEELNFIRLPIGIEIICEEAFYNCRYLPSDLLPDTTKAIKQYAFSHGGYTSERWDDRNIVIPQTVTEIQENAWGAETIPIVVPGSYAEKYCKEKGLRFRN